MTTPIHGEVERRGGGRKRPRTLAAALGLVILGVAATHAPASAAAATQTQAPITWPSPVYQENPVAFFRDVLGVEPWSRQVEIAELVRDHRRVAVSSGQKIGKSSLAAWIALWFFSSFDDARVVMTSTTSRQVDQILWRELRKAHQRAGWCVVCQKLAKEAAKDRREAPSKPCAHSQLLDGEPRELARTGLKAPDFREIVGFTARESEAVAGTSSVNLLYIVDEASGVADLVFEGIEGNRASGGRVLMLSQPTRTEGEFFEAFHSKSALYQTRTISSEETPNVVEGRMVVPGLALREYIEEKKLEWGEDHPLYRIRVKGQFVLNEDGKVISAALITEATKRWEEVTGEGRLTIGIDPAGESGTGDESCLCSRRGQRVNKLYVHRGLSDEGHVIQALGVAALERRDGDQCPIVTLDAEGKVGSEVRGAFQRHLAANPGAFELVIVLASNAAQRDPQAYGTTRDELWANGRNWLKAGGAIPDDAKLAKELHAPEWTTQALKPQLKVTDKKKLRAMLGRSPDRADAFCLAVWERGPIMAPPDEQPASPDPEFASLDPYAGQNAWRTR